MDCRLSPLSLAPYRRPEISLTNERSTAEVCPQGRETRSWRDLLLLTTVLQLAPNFLQQGGTTSVALPSIDSSYPKRSKCGHVHRRHVLCLLLKLFPEFSLLPDQGRFCFEVYQISQRWRLDRSHRAPAHHASTENANVTERCQPVLHALGELLQNICKPL